MKKILPLTLGLIMSFACSADAGWTGSRAIVDLEVTASGTEVFLEGFNGACTGTQGNTWTKIEVGQANEKQLLAALFMAFASGKNVNVYCSSGAQWAPVAHILLSGS